jgi:hypothetical protein
MTPRAAAALLMGLALTSAARAPAETAAGLVERMRATAAQAHDRTMRVTLQMESATGGQQTRSLRGYEKRAADGWQVLWIFDSPADLAGTTFLARLQRGEPDALWAYFPAQARVRQLPAQRRAKFEGSDFTYEDLRLLAFDFEAQHRLEDETACGEATCYVLETTFPGGEFAYDRLRSWIRADTLIPERVEFFDRGLDKVMHVLRAARVQGVPTVLALRMETPDGSRRTSVEFHDVVYNTGLADTLFSSARLETASR